MAQQTQRTVRVVDIPIPTFESCHPQRIEVATPKDRLDADAETEARIRKVAFETFICHHPAADDCLRVYGTGSTPAAAYKAMLEELHEHYADSVDDPEYWRNRIELHQDMTAIDGCECPDCLRARRHPEEVGVIPA